ncbi:hypothetical protein M8J77_002962 [Diaphorina citri]|nr:hypothetical protein M8J77_002962 [Diaphorina citri]
MAFPSNGIFWKHKMKLYIVLCFVIGTSTSYPMPQSVVEVFMHHEPSKRNNLDDNIPPLRTLCRNLYHDLKNYLNITSEPNDKVKRKVEDPWVHFINRTEASDDTGNETRKNSTVYVNTLLNSTDNAHVNSSHVGTEVTMNEVVHVDANRTVNSTGLRLAKIGGTDVEIGDLSAPNTTGLPVFNATLEHRIKRIKRHFNTTNTDNSGSTLNKMGQNVVDETTKDFDTFLEINEVDSFATTVEKMLAILNKQLENKTQALLKRIKRVTEIKHTVSDAAANVTSLSDAATNLSTLSDVSSNVATLSDVSTNKSSLPDVTSLRPSVNDTTNHGITISDEAHNSHVISDVTLNISKVNDEVGEENAKIDDKREAKYPLSDPGNEMSVNNPLTVENKPEQQTDSLPQNIISTEAIEIDHSTHPDSGKLTPPVPLPEPNTTQTEVISTSLPHVSTNSTIQSEPVVSHDNSESLINRSESTGVESLHPKVLKETDTVNSTESKRLDDDNKHLESSVAPVTQSKEQEYQDENEKKSQESQLRNIVDVVPDTGLGSFRTNEENIVANGDVMTALVIPIFLVILMGTLLYAMHNMSRYFIQRTQHRQTDARPPADGFVNVPLNNVTTTNPSETPMTNGTQKPDESARLNETQETEPTVVNVAFVPQPNDSVSNTNMMASYMTELKKQSVPLPNEPKLNGKE